ncbi:MAG TPA: zf-HC2 domain-containing protein [Fimbriimonadaceae bacterium]|nr:zf-HC2 domain-containing protein [Fimbriimonadaceae bacterium]
MQVQNFECQIAKAQIGRYVAGDRLSDEALEQLEAHITKCPDCKQSLAERRAALQAMLSLGKDEQPATPKGSGRPKFDLATFIKSKIQAKQPVQAAVQTGGAKPSNFTKPALYSLALGVVLIGMSYVSKNLGSVFGPTAAETASKQATPPKTESPKPSPASATPKAAPIQAAPAADPLTKVQAGATAIAPTTQTNSDEPKYSHHHREPRPKTNTIRVYEPEN